MLTNLPNSVAVSGNVRIRSSGQIFEYTANSDTCGRSCQQISEFANVTLSDPVFKLTWRIDPVP